MVLGSIITPLSLATNLQSKISSQLTKEATMYYASIELRAAATCFILNQEIIPISKLKEQVEVFFLFSTYTQSNQQNHEVNIQHLMNSALQISENMLGSSPIRIPELYHELAQCIHYIYCDASSSGNQWDKTQCYRHSSQDPLAQLPIKVWLGSILARFSSSLTFLLCFKHRFKTYWMW